MIYTDAYNPNIIATMEQNRLNSVLGAYSTPSAQGGFDVSFTIAVSEIQNVDIEKIFQDLARKWRMETFGSSSPIEIIGNPNYLEIIKQGGKHKELILKLILADLQKGQSYWFEALRIIADYNPVKPEEFSNYRLVTEAWLNWGIQKGYL